MADGIPMLLSVLGDEVTPERAHRLLEMSGGDVNLAIALFFDSDNARAEGEALGGGGGDNNSARPPQPVHGSPRGPIMGFPVDAHEPQDPANGTLLWGGDGDADASPPSIPRDSSLSMAGLDLNTSHGPRLDDQPPTSTSEEHRPVGLRIEDTLDEEPVLVHFADSVPEPQRVRRSMARPGTAPLSRQAGSDERDMTAKKDAMRCVVGAEVDDVVLEHLLRSSGLDVQAAVEAYFEFGASPDPGDLSEGSERAPPSRHRHSPGHRRLGARQEEQDEGEEDRPRRPFVDLVGMIGNNMAPSVLAALMVESEGDVGKALELYQKRKAEDRLPPRSPEDSVTAEDFYLRPEKPVPVVCNVYDLSWGQDKDGKKKKTNSGLTGVGLGVYHSGIEVYGREFSFGYSDDGSTGVFEVPCKCAAGVMPNITFKESVVMGTLNRSRFELDHLLQRLATKYRGDTYDLVRRNCNHFANELCVCLVGKKIPGYINRPANMGRVLLNTIQVPAIAFGKIMDGVKGGGKRRDQPDAPPSLVVPAPVPELAAAGAREDGSGRGGGRQGQPRR